MFYELQAKGLGYRLIGYIVMSGGTLSKLCHAAGIHSMPRLRWANASTATCQQCSSSASIGSFVFLPCDHKVEVVTHPPRGFHYFSLIISYDFYPFQRHA